MHQKGLATPPNEYKAIKSFLEGKEPYRRGAENSYAMPSLLLTICLVGSIALIVSPLKALMKDQVSPLVATLMVI